MNNFNLNQIEEIITQIQDQNDLLNLAEEYNGSKIKFENRNLIFYMDCFVNGDESMISVSISNDSEIEYDIWINGDEFFIDTDSKFQNFN
ncbi:hypothetical protein [Gluconobacter frateurii]|uniref:Uncharacterized protein n=1 Tax=Gluconobacter frateurii NRIC 0228 TaxID=1307946 RepID=A0ABQ0QFP4_9PROT|nr:hypothetical protein [Gluconobacter frateurii]GBR17433.1 hypothetical protein AA0228_3026 [Gluconobacter frateurii NRIC 0228]GLP89604.1 hypothetical protein GCM10007868_06790 [Gluconobacter frateurii]